MSTLLEKILRTNKILTKNERNILKKDIISLKKKEYQLKKKILQSEMTLIYNSYKEKGFKLVEIKNFYKKDLEIIKNAKECLNKNLKLKKYMFGYPANMEEIDYIEEFLKYYESQLPLCNNCGEPYNEENKCNYAMDTKYMEYQIVEEICNNLNLSMNNYRGYITSGGTEGNYFGIRNGFEVLDDGVFYYSEAAHYSVSKFIKLLGKENEKIDCDNQGKINIINLIEKVEDNWQKKHKSAVILLTWGTTEMGAIDNIEKIINILKIKKIPYYIHLDAAFYGGIPKNQDKAPIINIKSLNIDSISVSLHKFIGSSLTNGVVIWKKSFETSKYITYIGQKDNTILGSRSILPFSTYYRVSKILNRSESNKYTRNVNYFQNQLDKNLIEYIRLDNGNIFVINNISNDVAIKYQLASIKNTNQYHVIIMPFHEKKYMNELINDIRNSRNSQRKQK